MRTRLASALAVVALACAALAGCTPQPEPTPTPTGFATEQEAFAAAEETYRAYVDALNSVDLSDPETFEDVYAWTTGEANANERKTLSDLHARGMTVGGVTETISFEPLSADLVEQSVVARACSDVSAVTLVDSEGNSVVTPDRRDRYALEIAFVDAPTPTHLAIASSSAVEDPKCAP